MTLEFGSKLRRIVGAVIALGVVAACEPADERALSHFENGKKLEEDGDTSRALLEYREAVRLNDDLAPAYIAIADIRFRENNLRSAVGHYKKAVEVDESNVQARIQLGRIMLGGGQLDEALKYAMSSVQLQPDNVDALILRGGSMPAEIVRQCTQFGIPVISSGRPVTGPGVDNVCCRNADGTRAVTRLLLARGRRRFGHIAGPDPFHSSADRRNGVIEALGEAGLPLIAEATGDFTVDGGYQVAAQLLRNHDLDALVCANDAMAIGALAAARDLGRDVPGDLSVTGFDDIAMASWPTFGLTTVRNPIDTAICQIIDFLERRLADPARATETVFIDPQVIERRTH